jgi:DNA mismatch endonuclease (patch repair protein)
MTDTLTAKQRSLLMAKIRSRGNASTEMALAAAFRSEGVSGWRRHRLILLAPKETRPGRRASRHVEPDFVFARERIAVFVDGCFWHACPRHGLLPQSRKDYWKQKLKRNAARDRDVNKRLHALGWRVIRIWEHSVSQDAKKCALRIRRLRAAVDARSRRTRQG